MKRYKRWKDSFSGGIYVRNATHSGQFAIIGFRIDIFVSDLCGKMCFYAVNTIFLMLHDALAVCSEEPSDFSLWLWFMDCELGLPFAEKVCNGTCFSPESVSIEPQLLISFGAKCFLTAWSRLISSAVVFIISLHDLN